MTVQSLMKDWQLSIGNCHYHPVLWTIEMLTSLLNLALLAINSWLGRQSKCAGLSIITEMRKWYCSILIYSILSSISHLILVVSPTSFIHWYLFLVLCVFENKHYNKQWKCSEITLCCRWIFHFLYLFLQLRPTSFKHFLFYSLLI